MKTARLLILALLFCITLVAGVHASAYAETVASGTWESLNWTLDDDGLLIISGNGEMAGFYNTTDITSTWRQYKNRIYEIIIENGVTTIGDSAFQDCNNLAKILIPDSITRIGNNAFYYCGQLKSIAIPYSVRSIGKSAFYSCSQLTEINYLGTENEWNTIQIETNNKVLTTATVHYKYIARGKSGSMIWELDDGGELVIENNGDMPNYQYFWDIPWYNYRDQILNIIVSDTTSSITAYAFLGCSNVESIVLPDSIISIGNSAFQDCSKLTSIFIPNGVETIGISAFTNCSSLKNIDIPDNVSIIAKSTFSNCLSLTSVKVSKNTTTIDESAFYNCSLLDDVILPEKLISVRAGAFSNCVSMATLSLSSSLTNIANDVFLGCENLSDIYYNSTEESRVCRESGWTKTGNETFMNATWHYEEEPLVWRTGFCGAKGENITWTLYDDGLLKISGSGRMADYDGNGGPWGKNFIKTVVIDSGVTSIGKCAFQSIWDLSSVIIPESVTRIGDSAFSLCGELSNIRIPGSITYFGRSPFSACNSIKTVGPIGGGYNLELAWTDCIPEYAFYNCYALTSITIPEGISTIGQNAFGWCSALEEIKIPSGTTTIAQAVFNNCQNLVTIHLPSSVTTIEDGAFSECPKICDVYYGSTETSREYREEGWSRKYNDSFFSADWYYQEEHNVLKSGICGITGENLKWNLFDDGSLEINGEGDMADYELPYSTPPWQSSAETVSIGDGVTSIDNYAFRGDQKIRYITIPSSITFIGNNAFYNCTSLTDIYYSGTQEQWESIRNIRNISLPQATMVHCAPLQTVTVSYDANGGVNAPETQTKAYGEGLKLSETIPIRNGFFFLGWAEGIGAFDPTYLPGDYFTKNTDTILYAVWAQPDFLMPDALAIIEEEAFANCAFRFVALSEKTTQLQNAAFANCYKLKYIYIPDACVSINKDAFNGISNLTILCEPGSYAEYFASHWGFASLPVR